jgi:hypothetical protein
MTTVQSFYNTTDIAISDRTKDRKESIVPQAQGVSVEQDIFFSGWRNRMYTCQRKCG